MSTRIREIVLLGVRKIQMVLPDSTCDKLRYLYLKCHNQKHTRAARVNLNYGGFCLAIPDDHGLIRWSKIQPKRDQVLGIVAGAVFKKYPEREIVDIGANVGDTAAIMASHSKAAMVLIEASDYFFGYLQQNANLIPNETKLHHCFVLDGSLQSGCLVHLGGTAYFRENKGGDVISTKPIAELCSHPGFVKIDTDGNDFGIVLGNIDFIAVHKPVVAFENQIRTHKDMDTCNEVYGKLFAIGYQKVCVFDDQGYLMLTTSDLNQLRQLNMFMFQQYECQTVRKAMSNMDIISFHDVDQDLFQQVVRYYA